MPARKSTEEAGEARAAANPIDKSIDALHRKIDAITRFLETMFHFDIDKDGKIGSVRIGVLVSLFCVVAMVAYAGENIVWKGDGREGNAATIQFRADEGDDTADEGQISMDEDGSMYFSIGGTTRLSIDSAGDVASSGDLTAGTLFFMTAQAQTVTTNAYTLTPTGSYVIFEPNVVTTVTLANAESSGQVLWLYNKIATNVVIADSANVESTGALTLGVDDAVLFIGAEGTNWFQATAVINN